MDVTPTTPATKRPRTKAIAKDPTAPKPARKKLTTSRKKSTDAGGASVKIASVSIDLHGMIETTAFYLAAERNFAPGHELDDWLEAERRIKALHPI